MSKKTYIYILLIFFGFNVYCQRFDAFSFYNIRKITPDNISQIFTYVEDNRQELDNTFFIPYVISERFEKDRIFDNTFIKKLFLSNFLLLSNFNNINLPYVITNFSPKFDRKALFMNFFHKQTTNNTDIYFLFVNTNIQKENRYYIMEDSVKKLREFNIANLVGKDTNSTIILFLDTDYYNFRKICTECDFVDIIINFQNFENGNIYGKKIYNIDTDGEKIDRFDILFGKAGFLSIAQTKIPLEEIEPSFFVNRILKSRNLNEKK